MVLYGPVCVVEGVTEMFRELQTTSHAAVMFIDSQLFVLKMEPNKLRTTRTSFAAATQHPGSD